MILNSTSDIPKTLIINADDFGLTHSLNKGILKCFQDGILTSASILSNGNAFDEAVDMTKKHNLNVGIHLTLMDGQPVSESNLLPSLISKHNSFPDNYMDFARKFFFRKISLDDVERELRAQIDKFISTGLEPKHINGHNHVHMFPGIVDIIIRIMKEYGITFLRIPYINPFLSWKGFSLNSVTKLFLIAFSVLAKRKIQRYSLSTTDFFEGLFVSGNLDKDEVLKVVNQLKPGTTELMCHPGYIDKELLDLYPWDYNWEKELKALCDKDIRVTIEQMGIVLSGF